MQHISLCYASGILPYFAQWITLLFRSIPLAAARCTGWEWLGAEDNWRLDTTSVDVLDVPGPLTPHFQVRRCTLCYWEIIENDSPFPPYVGHPNDYLNLFRCSPFVMVMAVPTFRFTTVPFLMFTRSTQSMYVYVYVYTSYIMGLYIGAGAGGGVGGVFIPSAQYS